MGSYTPKEYSALLQRFADGLPEAAGDAAVVAAQQLKADIPGRIHRVGGTLTVDGNTRGYRTERWIREREDANKQIVVVDHTFNGDLQRSYKLFIEKKQISLKIVGENNVNKARGNERWYVQDGLGKVWEASETERDRAKQAFNIEMEKYVKSFFG